MRPTGTDTRVFWARHSPSQATAGAPAGAFRFNMGFFDGHVETVDDLTGANPRLWYPKGTELKDIGNQMYPDQLQRYYPGGPPASGFEIVP
jgi:prepilin-type processing-associated H-X9-DG protein